MANEERRYAQRRALEEIICAMRADSVEAEVAHASLANLHMRHCSECAPGKTRECGDCPMTHVCDHPGERRGTGPAIEFSHA
jgi:hypothetical protein